MSLLKVLKEPFHYKKIDWRNYRSTSVKSDNKPVHPHAARAGKAQKARDWKEATRRILAYLGRRKPVLAFVMVLVVASSLLTLVGPFLIGYSIDNYLLTMQFDGLGSVLLLLLASYIALSLATFFSELYYGSSSASDRF